MFIQMLENLTKISSLLIKYFLKVGITGYFLNAMNYMNLKAKILTLETPDVSLKFMNDAIT